MARRAGTGPPYPENPPGAWQHDFRYPAGEDLDTAAEQAQVLLHDLRESFAPSYLTLISIIQGVLLGFTFELLSEGRALAAPVWVSSVLVFNNVVFIALVWNEYRMGSFMFRWIPSLLDAAIPFAVGACQAALILTTTRPIDWMLWFAGTYAAGALAYENMYRRAAEEQRNSLVMAHNRAFRVLNPLACLGMAIGLGLTAASHMWRGTAPGLLTLVLVTLANLLFLARGEVNWRIILRVARRVAEDG